MSDAWRATLFLSIYFFAFGVQLPYLPVWLGEARDLNGAMIALAVFGAALGRVVTGPIITAWAEALSWRRAAFFLSFATAVAFAALIFAPGPWAIAAVGFLTLSLVHAIMPLGEAALLQASVKSGPSFGLGRAIASTVFVAGVLSGGLMIDFFGPGVLAPALAALFAITAATGLAAPKDRLGAARTEAGEDGIWSRIRAGVSAFRRPGLALMLLAVAPIQSAHAFYYGFSAQIWLDQGATGGLTSVLWGLGVVTEILLLAFAARLPGWVTPEGLILAGALGGVLRWTIMGLQPDFAFAAGLQLLHGLSFAATFLGTVRMVARDVPETERAAAFAFQAAIATGAFTGLIGLICGPLYDVVGVRGYWAMAGLCAFAVAPAYLMTRRRHREFPLLAR